MNVFFFNISPSAYFFFHVITARLCKKTKTEVVRLYVRHSNYCLKLWQEIFIITNKFSKWFITRIVNIILTNNIDHDTMWCENL